MVVEPSDTSSLEQRDFGLADCPYCDGMLYFPVLSWSIVSDPRDYYTEYEADYDVPRCANDCSLTNEDIQSAEIYEHITADVDDDGWPIDMNQGDSEEGT